MPPELDIDIVSDLNGTDTAGNVSAHGADVQHVNAEPITPPATSTPQADDSTPAKALSIREQISSALKGETAETPPAGQQDGGPARNPDGTFAPKPAVVADPNASAPAAPAPSTAAAPAGIDPQVFASLPAETQAQLARTMEGVAAQQARFEALQPVEQLIAPRIQAWALNGMQPAQALSQLFALSDFASRDAGGFIKYFAHNNGVDLADLVIGMEPAAPVDPAVAAMQSELAELRSWRDGQTQQQQQEAHNATVSQVVQFAEEKDAQGNPLRPYFQELGQSVLPYIEIVKRANPTWPHGQVLQQAYEQACWATPAVRQKLQDAANTAAEAERLRQNAARAENARAASASVRSGAPTTAPVAPDDKSTSVRGAIRAAIAANS